MAALLLRDAGYRVECLHMTNWEEDGYCEAAAEYRDARKVAEHLGLPLHRANFAREYKERVFADFLREHRAGRTPNPDVLCNREIKFGVLRRYARRLGPDLLATGHYARLESTVGETQLLKGADRGKDQSYFLHAVAGEDLAGVVFPLGGRLKTDVRRLAARAGLGVAGKKDSTGICFIGERPFAEFLSGYLRREPGPAVTEDGEVVGTHQGLAFYTIGQRQGLGVGGRKNHGELPWYVAGKDFVRNELVVVQGHDHPALYRDRVLARGPHWINAAPPGWHRGTPLRCAAKTRYRQTDRACAVRSLGGDELEVTFDEPQWAVTPGQYVVFYSNERCLGGAMIERAEVRERWPAAQAG